MRFHRQILSVLGAVLLAAVMTSPRLPAYAYSLNSAGAPYKWDAGPIPMQLKLGSSPTLTDGSNFNSSVQAAMELWNTHLATVQFVPQISSGTGGPYNGANEVIFAANVYGEEFDDEALAYATFWHFDGRLVEGDIIFNTAYTWDSYRAYVPSVTAYDIRRVALHELGHLLGLKHSFNDARPAVMQPTSSDIDTLQADDILGAQMVYGAPGGSTPPTNNAFASATAITLTNHSAQVSGTTAFATKQPGEPNHAGDIGGASAWWKWTATANGVMVVTTGGSIFDTLLGVYTGSAVSALSAIASSDDADPGNVITGEVTFNVTAGTTYYIAVDGWGMDSGAVTLNLSFSPPNLTVGITTPPASLTTFRLVDATFSVAVSGTPPFFYQWRKNGNELENGPYISGATTATLTVKELAYSDAGSYDVVIGNENSIVTSSAALLRFHQAIVTFGALADRAFTTTPITLSATASSSLAVSFSVVSGPATVSGNSLTLTGAGAVTVRATQAGNGTFAAASADQSFTVSGNFSFWRQTSFTIGELADVNVSGPNADYDHDGLDNLVEYALGLDPKTATTNDLPEVAGTATEWTFTYTRPAARTDVNYAVETSTTLANWSTATVTHTLVSTHNDTETWRATVPQSAGASCFFRLRVTLL